MLNVQERYRYDRVFATLVDTLTNMLREGNYTPTEVREAAMLAQLHFEDMRVRRFGVRDIDAIRLTKRENT